MRATALTDKYRYVYCFAFFLYVLEKAVIGRLDRERAALL
jgi:hypothetical protein